MPKSFSSAITTQTMCSISLLLCFRFLIETFNSLGFSASYNHVQQFNQSTAVYEGTDIPESLTTSLCNMQQITWATISVPLTGNTRSMEL